MIYFDLMNSRDWTIERVSRPLWKAVDFYHQFAHMISGWDADSYDELICFEERI